MGTCGTAPLFGSSRRKGGAHRKGHGTRKINRPMKMKGGMGFGFKGDTIGTAGAVYDLSWGGEVTKGGEPIYDTLARPAVGGRRRKAAKKGKKGKKRTMRGGAQWQSVGGVGYGFDGSGSRGLANAVQYVSKVPPAGTGPVQNPDGAYQA